MKTIILSLILLILSLKGSSQIKGVNFRDATTYEKALEISQKNEEGGFYKSLEKVNTYIYIFPSTPEGIRHCFEKLFPLLRDNELNSSKPSNDSEHLANDVGHMFDYVPLDNSLDKGFSEIFKKWDLDNGWSISLILKIDYYVIEISENN